MESVYGENVSEHVRLGGPPVDSVALLLVPVTPLLLYHLPGWTLSGEWASCLAPDLHSRFEHQPIVAICQIDFHVCLFLAQKC